MEGLAVEHRKRTRRIWECAMVSRREERGTLLLAALLPSKAALSAVRTASFDHDGRVFVTASLLCLNLCNRRLCDLCSRSLLLIQLLHEVCLDSCSPLLPPSLLGLRRSLQLCNTFLDDAVLIDLVGGLEDNLAPVLCEGVGLHQS